LRLGGHECAKRDYANAANSQEYSGCTHCVAFLFLILGEIVSRSYSLGNTVAAHDNDDEFLFVLGATFIIDLEGRSVALSPQQGFVVPKGLTHRTSAPERAETAAIVPTGEA
jgi:mannose-6-phosphate isomerase-like protein (cupin superfamily)